MKEYINPLYYIPIVGMFLADALLILLGILVYFGLIKI